MPSKSPLQMRFLEKLIPSAPWQNLRRLIIQVATIRVIRDHFELQSEQCGFGTVLAVLQNWDCLCSGCGAGFGCCIPIRKGLFIAVL